MTDDKNPESWGIGSARAVYHAMIRRRAWIAKEQAYESKVARELDAHILADAYDTLTDPTPLTEELVVKAGFVRVGSYYKLGKLLCTVYKGGSLGWKFPGLNDPVKYCPRTVGELNMYIKLMENR